MDKFVVKTPSTSLKPKTRSHLPVNITANDRARNYLEGTFHVDDGRLFCSSCNAEVERFEKESILDGRTHYKPTETFQYTNYNSCHPAGVIKGFVKGEALRLLRTNSSKVMFEENIKNFRTRLTSRGYPNNLGPVVRKPINLIQD